MALARRAQFGMAFTETNDPGIEMNPDGSLEVIATDGSRSPLPGGGASFPDEWTVGANGQLDVPILTVSGDGSTDYSLVVDTAAAAGKIAEFRTSTDKLVATFTTNIPNFAPGTDHPTLEVTRKSAYLNLDADLTGEFVVSDYDGNSILTVLSSGGVDITPPAGSTDNPLRVFSESGSVLLMFLSSGAILMPNLPTVDPASAGTLWNSAGTLKVSAG